MTDASHYTRLRHVAHRSPADMLSALQSHAMPRAITMGLVCQASLAASWQTLLVTQMSPRELYRDKDGTTAGHKGVAELHVALDVKAFGQAIGMSIYGNW